MIRLLQYAGLQSFKPEGKAFEPPVLGALYVTVRVLKKCRKS
jgi:hypothetical protein